MEEATAFAEALPAHLQAFTSLAFWAGLRLGELLGRQCGDVTLDTDKATGLIRVERQRQLIEGEEVVGPTKTDSNRRVNISGPVVGSLSKYISTRPAALPNTYLFTGVDGDPLKRYEVYRHWRKARITTGIEAVRPHDMRHGGLTLAAQTGASLAEVMRRAGHTSPRAAMLYQHAAADRDALLAERMTALAENGPKPEGARRGHATVTKLPRTGGA